MWHVWASGSTSSGAGPSSPSSSPRSVVPSPVSRAGSCSPATPGSASPAWSTRPSCGRRRPGSPCSSAAASTPPTPRSPTSRSPRSPHRLATAQPEIVAERAALRSLLPGTVVRDDAAGTDRALGQLRVFDAVLSALDALSAVSPTLLVVEDLHWADRSSRDLLVFLLSRLTAQRLVVLATYRRDDLHRRHPLRPMLSEVVRLPAVERLELEPLGGDESLELVRRLADGSVDEASLRRIARRSEGNAFFAEELVTAAPSGVPEGLAEVLMARIEALPAMAQRVLRIAAVSGRKVRHEVLAAVSDLGDDELEQALRDAVAHHVLVPDREACASAGPSTDGYVFRHALLREAMYQELLPGERTRLHARYAQRLAERVGESGIAAELAHHAYAGHDLPRALSASIAAAEEADSRDAPAEVLFQARTGARAVARRARRRGRRGPAGVEGHAVGRQVRGLHRGPGTGRAARPQVRRGGRGPARRRRVRPQRAHVRDAAARPARPRAGGAGHGAQGAGHRRGRPAVGESRLGARHARAHPVARRSGHGGGSAGARSRRRRRRHRRAGRDGPRREGRRAGHVCRCTPSTSGRRSGRGS